jgi:hypothetical protein
MGDDEVVPETRGVAVELLTTVDLGPELEGMAGRQLRMRRVTIQHGGVFGPLHDHKSRPGTLHWLENRGSVPAVEISVDVVAASE